MCSLIRCHAHLAKKEAVPAMLLEAVLVEGVSSISDGLQGLACSAGPERSALLCCATMQRLLWCNLATCSIAGAQEGTYVQRQAHVARWQLQTHCRLCSMAPW